MVRVPDQAAPHPPFDLHGGAVARKFRWPECGSTVRVANDVTFSPDGKYLITAERFGEVLIYETATGRLLVILRGHLQMASGVAMSADGRRLLSVSHDRTGLIWDFPALVRQQSQH